MENNEAGMEDATKLQVKDPEVPGELSVLPIRDIVVFPYMIIPLFVGRQISISAIENALAGNRMVLLLTQKDVGVETPSPADLYSVGTVGLIMRMLKLPDGRVKILVQGVAKASAQEFIQTEPFYKARIEKIKEAAAGELTIEVEALIRNVKEQFDKAVSLGKNIIPDVLVVIEGLDEPGRLADLIASNLGLKTESAQEVLEITEPISRLKKISEILAREIELLTVQQKIQTEARGEID
ncbi:MAG: LON peptidase substrate-binding domain-containing protein, partial [Nitrospiraceae bacterium]|nr:LON peptidase substrate-binding domain-containing protein [Nitrospiraceae bacterium]